jgi:phage terminase large subunit-like protein
LLQQALELSREIQRRKQRNRLLEYRPYSKQREFHDAGSDHRERLFMAGNQLGKTLAGSFEWAMHLTGKYPDWWKGRRFETAGRYWAAGESGTSTRDTVQKLLVGPPEKEEEWGTGAIPFADIVDTQRARGIPDALDSVVVKHVTGATSTLLFKSYEQGRAKWQGDTLHGVWFDEEPPVDIYTEGLTRTNATGGITMITFTPLKGMSEVVRMFLQAEL